jgi:glycosyltransferase involved in cell wall biosynthesis
MKLSVIMPVYNERHTLREVVERVLTVPLQLELICVDDGSRDAREKSWVSCRQNIRNCGFFCSPRTWARARLCGVAFRKPAEIL